MNRWLMPFLMIGLVSTIALLALSPLALSMTATTDQPTGPTRAESNSTAQLNSLSTKKTPLPPRTAPFAAPTLAERAATPLIRRPALAQLLAPRACYGRSPAPEGLPSDKQVGGRLPAAPVAYSPETSRPDNTINAVTPPSAALVVTLADLINQHRQQAGLPPLTLVPTLTTAAYRHSFDMATQSTPAHQGSDGSSGGSRMLMAGYQWQVWAEVIGWGFVDPATMVAWWLNDAEHRAVLLSAAFTEFGIGYATHSNTLWQTYWTVNFGRPSTTAVGSEPVAVSTITVPQAPTPTTAPDSAPLLVQPPVVIAPPQTHTACPTQSTQSYALIPMEGVDLTHPGAVHGDLNLAQRSYTPVTAQAHLIDLAGPVDPDAPQLAQLFAGNHPMRMTSLYQVADWQWQCGDHGCRGAALSTPEVTLLGLQAEPGTALSAPERQTSIYRDNTGTDYVAVVLYAESSRLTLAYTRDGSVANGYTVHLEEVCVDPNLVQRYTEADRNGRQQLPALQHGQTFGSAATSEVGIAIRDRGAFLDPRSRKDWWRGY